MQQVQQALRCLCSLVIRPMRCRYSVADLGPRLFCLAGEVYARTDLELRNPKGQVLKCSHFEPASSYRRHPRLPCVVYLHGNSGARIEALDCVAALLPAGITVFAFDFSGSGMSDGEYVSLGFHEEQDLDVVVQYLLRQGGASCVGLWGRSMGAVTAVMYASRRPGAIAGMVCDSPFSSLADVMHEMAAWAAASWLPELAFRVVLRAMRAAILRAAGFDIARLDTAGRAAECDAPALFAHAEGDTLVSPAHSDRVAARYRGECQLLRFAGDHNSERPAAFTAAVVAFFRRRLPGADPPRALPVGPPARARRVPRHRDAAAGTPPLLPGRPASAPPSYDLTP